jgi:hypothetical protein
MKKLTLAVAVVLLVAGSAMAISFPQGDFRASIVDRSNLYVAGVPSAFGALPAVGDENRSVFSVDAINFGSRITDPVGVTQIVDLNPQQSLGGYTNGLLSGVFYDIDILPGSAIPPAGPSLVAPWILFFGKGTRYTDAATGTGTDGLWTDLVPGKLTGLTATTAGGYGGLLVVYEDPALNTNFASGGGPTAWTEGTIVAPDPSLTASDAFPTISDVAPFLVCVLAPMPLGYGVVPGTLSLEVITGVANSGLAFANIIGGWGAGQFDTDVFGLGMDIRLEFEPIIGSGPIDGWQTASDDPVQFSVIPEPATLSLLGLGLAGLGLIRRRK